MKNVPKSGYYAQPGKGHEFNLLLLSKSTDAEESRRATNQLILENEKFLKSSIRTWVVSTPYHLDYVLQEARLALYKAIQNFDLHKGFSLRTYAKFHLLKLKTTLIEEVKFQERFSPIDDINVFDASEGPQFESFSLSANLDEAFSSVLTKTESEVIYLHFFEKLKLKSIAKARKCSPARISTVIKNALPKLKIFLLARGISPGIFELN
ncbi:MAG TPA: sigma-70 family RNA polymerase sigma factor [Chryseolinea sp.]|nr:sigma-70 family RNA polymerase sigma factor [Chryseolinea sp.]